jgi:hypothetical protein
VRFAVLVSMPVLAASSVRGQEGVFLSARQAPAAVFPDADHFAPAEVESTPELHERMSAIIGVWPIRYVPGGFAYAQVLSWIAEWAGFSAFVFYPIREMWFRDGRVSHATH